MGTQLPLPQRDRAPPIFDPDLLWLNGYMDQDATWYVGRPRPRRLCVRWGSRSPPQKGGGTPPQFSAHFYCGQTAGCIKMPFGIEVGLSPGDFMLYGGPSPPPKKGAEPQIFGMFSVAKRMGGSRWHLAWKWALVQATLC